jgi:ring-1,2-phenylacetyl-CoA epoxidase subunit PaaE
MSKFHTITVADIRRETTDTVSVAFDIPAGAEQEFAYTAGQYLTLVFNLNGEELRRSYSLCSAPGSGEKMRVAVKAIDKGKVSNYINASLKVGDKIQSMAPMGNFTVDMKSGNKKHYVGIAAGSGITPVFSLLKTALLVEPESKFTLVYANKTKASTIFGSELEQLQNQYKDRFHWVNVYSRENNGNETLNGRLDKNNVQSLVSGLNLKSADHFFICGPEEMILNASAALENSGIAKDKVHFELFTTPTQIKSTEHTGADDTGFNGDAKVTVIIDGIETNFTLNADGQNILDAAMDAGADAPFSCKGAVCCTCKAKVVKGKAHMMMNYALTDKEVEQGYILTCQAHPRSEKVVVDYDVA